MVLAVYLRYLADVTALPHVYDSFDWRHCTEYADVDIANCDGNTALNCAAYRGHALLYFAAHDPHGAAKSFACDVRGLGGLGGGEEAGRFDRDSGKMSGEELGWRSDRLPVRGSCAKLS